MTGKLRELALAVDLTADRLVSETVEAGPGGVGNPLRLGLAMRDMLAAVDAFQSAYDHEVRRTIGHRVNTPDLLVEMLA